MKSNWMPILTEGRHRIGMNLIADIDDCVAPFAEADGLQKSSGQHASWYAGPSVANGLAGHALFQCHAYRLKGNDDALQRCNTALWRAAQWLGEGMKSSSLYSGLTGVGWSIEHIGSILGENQMDAFSDLMHLNEQIDDYLSRWVRLDRRPFDYDLIRGLVGIGVYFLARLPRPDADKSIRKIIALLALHATTESSGITWLTPPEVLPPNQAKVHPHGYYNLGLAHGIPGIIAFLSKAHAAGIMQSEVEDLLRRSIAWLLQHRLPSHSESAFGTVVSVEHELDAGSRAAWCYGDAGVAASLFSAAAALKDEPLLVSATDVANKAASRTMENAGVIDGSLCHGAFGLMQCFNRFYQFTGMDHFREKALYWFDQGVKMRKPDSPMSGYLFYDLGSDGNMAWRASPGLLMGIGGVGLTVMAGISSHPPSWDRLFLLDIQDQDRPCEH